MADYLKAAGYATGISGKWHIGEGEGFMAADRGFDFAFGTVANLEQDKKTGKGTGDFFRSHELLESPGWLVTSPMYAEGAVKFIDANLQHPFFLYVSLNAAHAPAFYSERWAEKCADIPTSDGQQRKTAQVGEMDEAIGTAMEKLRKLGLEENTLVFCIADNGRMDFVDEVREGSRVDLFHAREDALRCGEGRFQWLEVGQVRPVEFYAAQRGLFGFWPIWRGFHFECGQDLADHCLHIVGIRRASSHQRQAHG